MCVLVCRLFELVVMLGRGERSTELEILVLCHELSIVRRQVRRPQYAPGDRLMLAALSRLLPRRSWQLFMARPETVRIVAVLRKLGIDVSATLVRNLLRAAGVLPAVVGSGHRPWQFIWREARD